MTGGNQLKLSSIVVRHARSATRSCAAHERGAVVAGTSAGASIQSSHMVAFGVGRRDPQAADDPGRRRPRASSTRRVIDQHFDQRNRYGRLLMIVAQCPQLLGIGVDEDTCGRGRPRRRRHRVLRVLGRGRGDDLRRLADGHQRLRGQAVVAAAGQRAWCSTCCRPAPSSTSPPATLVPQEPAVDPRRTPTSSPRPAATCASWPATSPPATPRPPPCCAAALARRSRTPLAATDQSPRTGRPATETSA